MYYFIPSWYCGERQWAVEAPLWFRVFESLSFDDTINQIQMFQHLQEESALLILCYQPQLRYFLHKQDLLNSNYWSFFDDIQNIRREDTRSIQFKELAWPQGVSFIYTPFKVMALLGQEHLADIHFAENGNLLRIHFLEAGRDAKHYFFDDRGFLSSIRYFNDGEASHQDYLNEFGVWQVREHFTRTQKVIEIHQKADKVFKQASYDTWEDLFSERLALLKQVAFSPDDILVIATDQRHNELVIKNFQENKKIFSFFGQRFDTSEGAALERVMAEAALVVVDSEAAEAALKEELKVQGLADRQIVKLPPFDTRLRLGRSQSVKELLIYFLIDGIEEDIFWQAISSLLKVMAENPLIELRLISYERDRPWEQVSKALLQEIDRHYSLDRFTSISNTRGENNLEEDQKLELTAITFSSFTNESQIIKELDVARLVIDLSTKPHLYTQIASISAGIPQINRVATEYVSHMENGWIISDLAGLEEAVSYYFEGLSNWNRSLIRTVQKMGDYSSGRLIAKWKELLEG